MVWQSSYLDVQDEFELDLSYETQVLVKVGCIACACVIKLCSASKFWAVSRSIGHVQLGVKVRPSPPNPKLFGSIEYNFTSLLSVVSIQIMEKYVGNSFTE